MAKARRAGRAVLKYAELYSVEEYTDGKGRTRKRVRYNGPWTCLDDPGKGALLRMAGAAAAGVAAAASILYLQMIDPASGSCWYVRVPQLAALFPGLFMLFGITELPWNRKPMPKDKYMHGIIRCCRSGLAAGILMTLSLIGEILFRSLNGAWALAKADTLSLILLAVSVLGSAGCMLLLRDLDVHEADNGAYPGAKK